MTVVNEGTLVNNGTVLLKIRGSVVLLLLKIVFFVMVEDRGEKLFNFDVTLRRSNVDGTKTKLPNQIKRLR